jgi:hypothetical protein
MKAERLYAKVILEAERGEERRYEAKRLEVIRRNAQQPESKADQDIKRICQLRKKTGDIYYQLELDRRLKAELEHFLRASMQLREAKLSAAERRAERSKHVAVSSCTLRSVQSCTLTGDGMPKRNFAPKSCKQPTIHRPVCH